MPEWSTELPEREGAYWVRQYSLETPRPSSAIAFARREAPSGKGGGDSGGGSRPVLRWPSGELCFPSGMTDADFVFGPLEPPSCGRHFQPGELAAHFEPFYDKGPGETWHPYIAVREEPERNFQACRSPYPHAKETAFPRPEFIPVRELWPELHLGGRPFTPGQPLPWTGGRGLPSWSSSMRATTAGTCLSTISASPARSLLQRPAPSARGRKPFRASAWETGRRARLPRQGAGAGLTL